MSEAVQTVENFIDAWNEIDLPKIMSYFADDCVYHNIPMDPMEGVVAIRAFIEGFVGMAAEIRWETHHIGETSSGEVLTERTDNFKIGEKWVSIRVMGIFELRDGKLIAWRDYFDAAQFQSQMAG